jgi:hypothetical protein
MSSRVLDLSSSHAHLGATYQQSQCGIHELNLPRIELDQEARLLFV